MKHHSNIVKALLILCFFAALAGCDKQTEPSDPDSAEHGHSHD